MDVEGEDDDVPSPRTLRAAAERLAQYTSEQPDAGPPTQGQGFADIYSEVDSSCPAASFPFSSSSMWPLQCCCLVPLCE